MKYISIFFTILFIWIAALMAVTFRPGENTFTLFVIVVACTAILFLIGFGKK